MSLAPSPVASTRVPSPSRAFLLQCRELGRGIADRAGQFAGQPAAGNCEAIAHHALEPELLGHTDRRNDGTRRSRGRCDSPCCAGLPPAYARPRPAGCCSSRHCAIAFFEPFEQGDTLAQRAFELQLATHCPLGNVGNAILDPGEIGQFVDAFLPDHGRIHVGDEQPRHLYLMRSATSRSHWAKCSVEDAVRRDASPCGSSQLEHIATEIEHLPQAQPASRHQRRLRARHRAVFPRRPCLLSAAQ